MILINLNTQEYPVSIEDFRSRFPDTSFPVDITKINFEEFGYAIVIETAQPQNLTYKQSIKEIVPLLNEFGKYEQVWETIDITATMTPEELTAFMAKYTASKISQIAALRYVKETAGIEINGMKIKTDRESQALINGAYVSTIINPDFTIDWKCENGWITLNATQISAIASNVAIHVQSCFTREKALQELITIDPETEIIW